MRHVVLDIVAMEFVLASVCFGILYRQSRTPFLIWYSLGMLLIGLCMVTLVISGVLWTPLAWIARLGIYLGGVYLFIAIWNISESGSDSRIPLERALRDTGNKYHTIVETAGEGIVIASPDGAYSYVNQRMADMLGYSVDEILGKSSWDFTFDDYLPQVLQARKDLQKRDVLHGEFKFRRKDGSVLWSIYNATPIFNDYGEHVTNMAMHTDNTERKRTEEALRESKDRAELRSA